jgi:hypothetical protein
MYPPFGHSSGRMGSSCARHGQLALKSSACGGGRRMHQWQDRPKTTTRVMNSIH